MILLGQSLKGIKLSSKSETFQSRKLISWPNMHFNEIFVPSKLLRFSLFISLHFLSKRLPSMTEPCCLLIAKGEVPLRGNKSWD